MNSCRGDVSRYPQEVPYLDDILGPGTCESAHPWGLRDTLPDFAFRVMSEEHFQKSLREGVHTSDQRGCYIGQKAEEPDEWGDEEAPDEGVVAGRWPYLGYLPNAECGKGRVVKIEIRPEDGWKVHPWDEEGGYLHTMQPLPASRFVGWSEPFLVEQPFHFELIRDGSERVHLNPPYSAELVAQYPAFGYEADGPEI